MSIKAQSITIAKIKCRIQHTKKNGKALHILINNVKYLKAMKNLRNRIDVRLENQNQAACHKNYLTMI